MNRFRRFSVQLKNSWLLFAFAIVVLILWNTHILFEKLSLEERSKMELWAKAQKEYIQGNEVNNITFEVLQRTGVNPMIQVDDSDRILELRNIKWDANEKDSTRLYQLLEGLKKENEPILIQYRNPDGALLINQKLYYGNSETLKKLQYYPLALLLIIFLFGAVLFFGFRSSKIAEQNRLWAAMAKETAHQIGTPLTSIIGWSTLLKESGKYATPTVEIEKDIERLSLITERFSKVGSPPELKAQNVIVTVNQTLEYLKNRSSKQITFHCDLPDTKVIAPINSTLLSWTLENLIKNAIDAMKGKGELTLTVKEQNSQVFIWIKDTGKGMKKEVASQLFNPGFTTKKRGWGLGLSLAKRIIVDFHKGKISVLKSSPNQGTTFEIILNL